MGQRALGIALDRGKAARDENNRLRAALSDFGWHKITCPVMYPGSILRNACDCGWDKLVRHYKIRSNR